MNEVITRQNITDCNPVVLDGTISTEMGFMTNPDHITEKCDCVHAETCKRIITFLQDGGKPEQATKMW